MDAVDREILGLLQAHGRLANAEVARRVRMVPSATFERIRKLEERGVVAGYEARLNPKPLGLGLLAFLFVRAAAPAGDLRAARALAAIPEVLEVHHIAGEDCYLVKIRARDTEDLARLMREKLGDIPEITSTRTTIVLETVKETGRLPLTNGAG